MRKKGQGGVRFEDGIGYRTPTEEELTVLHQSGCNVTEGGVSIGVYQGDHLAAVNMEIDIF